MEAGLQRWHRVVEEQDAALLAELLTEDAVFVSPVLHRPVAGRDMVILYLTGAMHVLGVGSDFRYVREVASGDTAVLEFETEVDGLIVNGVDMIRFTDDGLITEFKVMLRPLSGIHAVKERMAALLASHSPA
jgi:ketosteroid isomerase-like protein